MCAQKLVQCQSLLPDFNQNRNVWTNLGYKSNRTFPEDLVRFQAYVLSKSQKRRPYVCKGNDGQTPSNRDPPRDRRFTRQVGRSKGKARSVMTSSEVSMVPNLTLIARKPSEEAARTSSKTELHNSVQRLTHCKLRAIAMQIHLPSKAQPSNREVKRVTNVMDHIHS